MLGTASSLTGRGLPMVVLTVALLAAGCTQAGGDTGAGPGGTRRIGQPTAAARPRLAAQPWLDEATGVVRTYWRARSLAFSAHSLAATQGDVRPLALHEDGAAAILSREVVQDARLSGKPPPQTSNPAEIRVYVPRPGRFPRAFLAAVTATHPDFAPEIYLLVFTRHDAKASWRASWWIRYADNTALPAIMVDRDGFATQLSPERQRATLLADTSTVERRLRDYLLEAYYGDAPPRSSFFADNAETYGEAKRRQYSRVGVLREGLVGDWVLYDARQPGFAFRTSDGALLALTVGRDSVEHWMQPITQDPRQLAFDRRIPPGTYTTVTWRYLGTYAVAVPTAGSHDGAVALASRWAVADVVAEP